ncbi:hypothetical protein [Frankia sp. Cppng1_Ct_nod]|uniref:hypothetical protein n=1 Tax=Frankia sp. Cppng1_Ct_nod TaxID=2897162 RepID=UPI0010419CD0|nr:hypothetical protein [Frankia sp. Cppng1_Ct_nod]
MSKNMLQGADDPASPASDDAGKARLPTALIESQQTFSRMWTLTRSLTEAVATEQTTVAALALAYATHAPDAEVTDAERVWRYAHQVRHSLQEQLAAGALGVICDELADRLLIAARAGDV